jgi:hypothetical protein
MAGFSSVISGSRRIDDGGEYPPARVLTMPCWKTIKILPWPPPGFILLLAYLVNLALTWIQQRGAQNEG